MSFTYPFVLFLLLIPAAWVFQRAALVSGESATREKESARRRRRPRRLLKMPDLVGNPMVWKDRWFSGGRRREQRFNWALPVAVLVGDEYHGFNR